MARTIYFTATSVDGFIADPDNSLDWLFEVAREEGSDEDAFAAFYADVGVFAMGSTTYEWVLREEGFLEQPDKWTEAFGGRPAWVFSHRDLPMVPGADLNKVQGDVTPVHKEMVEAADGRNVWIVGGGDLVGAFADQGLLDEIHLTVQPVFLGGGAPLLPRRMTSERVSLTRAERTGQEVTLVYEVAPPA